MNFQGAFSRSMPINISLISLTIFCSIGLAISTSVDAKALESNSASGGRCSSKSHWVLDANPNNGKIEVEFEVIQRPIIQVWSVVMKDNSKVILKQKLTTSNEGSFTADKVINDLPGIDKISAKAVNLITHEVCQGIVKY